MGETSANMFGTLEWPTQNAKVVANWRKKDCTLRDFTLTDTVFGLMSVTSPKSVTTAGEKSKKLSW